MTAQTDELLLIDGRCEWLQNLPLQPYLDDAKIDLRRLARSISSSMWRGYQAAWEVADGRLYLIGLMDCNRHPFDPDLVFPGRRLPIAADWFSGTLALGQGESLTYFHMGWGHQYETLLRLYFKEGRLVARRRYDQTRVFRRRFDRFVALHPHWRQILLDEARSGLQPLGGCTVAGLKALGRPELLADGMLSVWPGDSASADSVAFASPVLEHCTRPDGAAALVTALTAAGSG